LNPYLFIIFIIATSATAFFLLRTNFGDLLLQINDWLDSIVETYPGVVTPVVGGFSYESRQMKGVKVSFNAENPVVIFEGGVSSYPTTYFAFLI
jgi:hypothetical protein